MAFSAKAQIPLVRNVTTQHDVGTGINYSS